MTISLSLTLTELLLGILIIAGIVVLVYLAVVLKNLVPSLRSLANITAETEAIVKDVRKKTEGLGNTLADTAAVLENINSAFHGNQNIAGAATTLVNAAASLAGLTRKSGKPRK